MNLSEVMLVKKFLASITNRLQNLRSISIQSTVLKHIKMNPETITKIDVIRRHTEFAIRSLFKGEDIVPIIVIARRI